MASQAVALLQSDYQSLSKEAGRRHSDVREAADKALQILKTSRDQALADLKSETPAEDGKYTLYQPIFLASATRNAKVIALAVSALQRLITNGAVPKKLVKPILDTLEQVQAQGVEIQLKILQTLVSLLTTKRGNALPLVQGEELGQSLELSHRLSTSRIPVVASTASATLRQMFMFVFDRVGDEDSLVTASPDDPHLPPASFNLDVPPMEHDAAAPPIPLPEGAEVPIERARSISLRPAARDAYLLLEDLCLLISGSAEGGPEGEPSFLRWGSLSRTFGLELVESIVSGFGSVVRNHPELLLVLRAHLCPLLIRFLSSPPSPSSSATASSFSFPLTLRLTRVVFLLLKQFSDLLALESEVFLTMFIRVMSPGDKGADNEGGHPAGPGAGSSPLWLRVLSLEIFRGLCGDFPLMLKFYRRYDAQKTENDNNSAVFSDMMTAFNRLATEKPSALGTGAAVVYGSSMAPIHGQHAAGGSNANASVSTASLTSAAGMLDSAMETGAWLAGAAGSVVGSGVGVVAGSVQAGLSLTTSTLKLQCIDQLDKAEAPPIPETYIFLLALQCLASLSDGFASFTLSTFSAVNADQAKSSSGTAPAALDFSKLHPDNDARVASLLIVKSMAETSWPAFLASFSFFIATNLDEDLFTDVVGALQNFTSVCGVLGLDTPREAFLTSMCKFAMPPSVVSYLATSSSSTTTNHGDSAAVSLKTATTAAISAGVESLGLGSTSLPVGLSTRNVTCLRALISVAHYLAGTLGSTWFAVFETLQNADFVIRVNAAKAGRKRFPTATVPPTPPRHGSSSSASALMSPSAASNATSHSKPPSQPTEVDEQSIQESIAKLFEVSRSLDDEAFKWFIGSLCRLDGEMLGIPMTEEGTLAESALAAAGTPSPGGETPLDTRSRRRSSGISTAKSQRLGEKSFGLSKIGVVSLFNISRLQRSEPRIGWDIVTSHLLLVAHLTGAPQSLRLQAAEVLDSVLIAAPKDLPDEDLKLRARVHAQVLVALDDQAEPSHRTQSSTDIEIRRLALDTLFKILESDGHSFTSGWDRIFRILRSACPSAAFAHSTGPPSPVLDMTSPRKSYSLEPIVEGDSQASRPALSSYFSASDKPARTPVLVRTSFPSLQLVCSDFLSALSSDELRDCIGTLAEFGKQIEDVNVALTAGGLLWNVSDHLQSMRKDVATGSSDVYGELWMFLLHRLLGLCDDGRQEVRDGAITTIFRSISIYGPSLSTEACNATLWEIIFPLVESITDRIRRNQEEAVLVEGGDADRPELVVQTNGPPIRLVDKQGDDSKTLVLRSMGDVFFDFLPVIVKTAQFGETWSTFVTHLKMSFIIDRPQTATAAVQSLEKVLTVSLDGSEADKIVSSWEVAWQAWTDIGSAIGDPQSDKIFTQVNLEAYVRCVLPIYAPPHIQFDLERVKHLLAILKNVLTFKRSMDFRPDVDSLTPLQATILEVIAIIDLDLPSAASAVLSDLSEYATLAFTAAFNSPQPTIGRAQSVSYIALTKEIMPHLLWLFERFRDDPQVYEEGAVSRMLHAYSIPIKLKHDCPAPAKFGSAEPLWKTATVNYLKAVTMCVASMEQIDQKLSSATFEAVWQEIIEGLRGAVLAENALSQGRKPEDLQEEENFDLALLITIEQHLVPKLGSTRIPDRLVCQLGQCVQLASRLYELDLSDTEADLLSYSEQTPSNQWDDDSPQKETRFDPSFAHQARARDMCGTTAEVVELSRERFSYWAFDLLFLICSDAGEGVTYQRAATLCLPALMDRCAAVMRTYIADAPLRGRMPFPRIRQEELVYVLQKLRVCRLGQNTLWASQQTDPSAALVTATATSLDASLPPSELIRAALLRSPMAHLYELHHLMTALVSLSLSSSSVTPAYHSCRRSQSVTHSDESVELRGLPEGFARAKIGGSNDAKTSVEGDVVQLALSCLQEVGTMIGSSF